MWKPSIEQFKGAATKPLSYFERLVSEEGEQWRTNATIVREWSCLLNMQDPPPEHVRAFALLLSSPGVCAGSGWDEFSMWASKWLEINFGAQRL